MCMCQLTRVPSILQPRANDSWQFCIIHQPLHSDLAHTPLECACLSHRCVFI